MNSELYNHRDHFRIVYGWWKRHRKVSLDIETLSNTGIMIFENGVPQACTWIFMSKESPVAQLGWSISNPDIKAFEAHQAIQESIEYAIKLAKDMGYRRLITFSSSKGLTRLFEKKGFKKLIKHDVLITAL